MEIILKAAFVPVDTNQLGIFYFVWMALYVVINFTWDYRSPHTPDFHIAHISEKLPVLYNASTFASGLLLILSVFSVQVQKVAGDSVAPIVLAGLSAFLVGVSGVSPYKPSIKNKS